MQIFFAAMYRKSSLLSVFLLYLKKIRPNFDSILCELAVQFYGYVNLDITLEVIWLTWLIAPKARRFLGFLSLKLMEICYFL